MTTRSRRHAAEEALGVALAFAAVGLAVGAALAWRVPSLRHPPLWAASSGASFLVGFGCWWALAARRADASRGRGAAIGAIASILSHGLTWLLLGAGASGALFFTLASVGTVGLVTTPIGALIGGAAIAGRR